jgi:hypothetical protein
MKKIIFGLVALMSFGAYAQRSMVSLYGFNTGDTLDRSFQFVNGHGTSDNLKQNDLAFNYAYAITDMFQLGVQYKSHELKTSGDIAEFGDKSSEIGLFAIYNLANRLTNTPYLYIGYSIAKTDDADDLLDTDGDGVGDTDYSLEVNEGRWNIGFGYRWSMGSLGGMNFNFSPSVDLEFAKFETEASLASTKLKSDSSTTALAINIVKFDVLF